jgi:diguanylate cyclase (GGDEF)-like protein
MIVSKDFDEAEILKKSQELDEIILEEMKKGYYGKTVLGGELLKEFDIILDKLQLFDKIYHNMRIVDPIKKKVLEIKEKEACESDTACHEFWRNGEMCENCVSMRAYNQNDTVYKLEQKGSSIFMVTAVPITIKGKKLVLELLKNVTSNLYFESGQPGDGIKVLSNIEYMNLAAVRDSLTNLYNRRYIDEKLPADLLDSCLRNSPLSVIFADLDHFKSINDTYGHAAGDQVLIQSAEEFMKHIRSGTDWAARYGGEEFFICLIDTDHEAAVKIAERIRKSIMIKEIDAGSEQIRVTCSFGVHTVYAGNECPTVDSLIEIADKKLYRAKLEGRNRVV